MGLHNRLDAMLHDHLRSIRQREERERIPHSTPPFTMLQHDSTLLEHKPCTRKPARKDRVVSESSKAVHLTDPDIIRSYNENRVLNEYERAYTEHRSITWEELARRRYERHQTY